MIADGVARGDLWPLIDDEIDRALKKLDEIKPHITKWWIAGGEPQVLMNREYAMTTAPDGQLCQGQIDADFKRTTEGELGS
ncbi:hypothetical protein BSZ22_12470 [Bradyrhizobium canariense]|nr:hypothetical protein BSZ22_12470 [Bradyrhizobium canariense]